MKAANLKIPLVVGTNENLSESFEFWQDEAETVPVDLTGYTASFGMRNVQRPSGADLQASAIDGEVLVMSPNVVVIDITPDRLDELTGGNYDFEILLTAPTGRKTVKMRGKIQLRMGIA
jgi:hypothetical protein